MIFLIVLASIASYLAIGFLIVFIVSFIKGVDGDKKPLSSADTAGIMCLWPAIAAVNLIVGVPMSLVVTLGCLGEKLSKSGLDLGSKHHIPDSDHKKIAA